MSTKQTMRQIVIPPAVRLEARACASCGSSVSMPGIPPTDDRIRNYSLFDYLDEAAKARRENAATKAARKRLGALTRKIAAARLDGAAELLLTEDEYELAKQSTDGWAMHPAIGALVCSFDEAVDEAKRVEVDLQIVKGPQPAQEGGAQ